MLKGALDNVLSYSLKRVKARTSLVEPKIRNRKFGAFFQILSDRINQGTLSGQQQCHRQCFIFSGFLITHLQQKSQLLTKVQNRNFEIDLRGAIYTLLKKTNVTNVAEISSY